MPKRTDISTILIIGAGPDRHRPGLRVRLFRHAGRQGAEGGGLPHRPGQFQPGDDHDRSRTSPTRTYVEPITPEIVAKIIEKERYASRRLRAAADHGRPDGAQLRPVARRRWACSEKFDVEMIGATAEAIDKAEDRELFREAMTKIGLDTPRSHQIKTLAEALAGAGRHRPAGDHPPLLHHGRHRRRHRLQQGRVHRHHRARHRRLADQRGAGRGERARLEGVRDGGRPRQGGQLHHRLLDREHRPDGRPYRRFASPSRRR